MSGALFSVFVSTQTQQPNTKPRNQSQNRTETKPKAQPNPVPNPKPSPKTNPNVPSKWYCNCSSFLLCRTFLRNATASIRGLAVHIMMIKMNAKSESFQVCTNTHWLWARTNLFQRPTVIYCDKRHLPHLPIRSLQSMSRNWTYQRVSVFIPLAPPIDKSHSWPDPMHSSYNQRS